MAHHSILIIPAPLAPSCHQTFPVCEGCEEWPILLSASGVMSLGVWLRCRELAASAGVLCAAHRKGGECEVEFTSFHHRILAGLIILVATVSDESELATVACICNPRTQEAKAGGLL